MSKQQQQDVCTGLYALGELAEAAWPAPQGLDYKNRIRLIALDLEYQIVADVDRTAAEALAQGIGKSLGEIDPSVAALLIEAAKTSRRVEEGKAAEEARLVEEARVEAERQAVEEAKAMEGTEKK